MKRVHGVQAFARCRLFSLDPAFNIAPEYSPAMFGKLINESSSATYNHILTPLSGAKRTEALMEVDNNIIASLNYRQGLFMLRHSPSIAWHPQDHARIQGSSF